LSIIIIVLMIISKCFAEPFVNTDTGIGIGPWWAEGPGLSRGFQRCNCDSYRRCSCLDGSAFSKNIMFPQYYFNYL
jgi:predicted membrane protein